MKTEIYEELFKEVSARDFLKPVLRYYGKEENVSEDERARAKFLLSVLLNDSNAYKYVDMSNPLIDVPDIIKIFVLNYSNEIFMTELMQNPNFNSLCAQVFWAFVEKYPKAYYRVEGDVDYDIISNPYMPEEKLRELSKSSDDLIRRYVAANPNCPRDVFEVLKDDRIMRNICSLARNRNIPVDILESLAMHKSVQIRKAVAYNQSSSELVLRNLLSGKLDYELIRAVVRHHNCPVDLLEEFATYTHHCDEVKTFMVRRDIATNPNISKKAWETLMSDQNPMFRNAALSSKMCPLDMLRELDWKAKEASYVVDDILKRDNLPKELILYLTEECGADIRATVISNVELPQELLIKYSRDKSKKVRSAVVKYLRDKDALMHLIKSNNDDINTKCSAASRLSAGVLEEFVEAVKLIPESFMRRLLIMQYIGNENITEDEMWDVVEITSDWVDEKGKSLLSTRDLLQSISYRKNLSEGSMEMAIRIALDNGQGITILQNYKKCKNFYSIELLDLLTDMAFEDKLR